MIVRKALAADLPALAPLFDRYRQFYGQPADVGLAHAFLSERLLCGESVVLMAFEAGRAVGFVQLYPSFSSVRAARMTTLNDLYVDPAHRRAGAGQALVQAAVAHARAQGACAIVLQTARSNAPAQTLYERLGWTRDTGFYDYALSLADAPA